jgi:hypothetical protein
MKKKEEQSASQQKVKEAIGRLIKILGVVNGTITVQARGGEPCRGVEIISRLDVLSFE